MEEVLNSKIGSEPRYRLPISSKEERLDDLYEVLKGSARFFGMDIGNVVNLFYKSMDEHKKQHNGESKEIDRRKYAISVVEKEVDKSARLKEVDDFIESEKKFRKNQLRLPLNLEISFRYQHQI